MFAPVRRRFVFGGLLALACLFASGCGSRTATIVGRVMYKGQPVVGGSVVVYCSDKQIARGVIEVDGTYSIPNVPFGTSVVTVQAPARIPAGLRMQQTLPPSSGGPISPAAETGDPARPPIPMRYSLPEESGLSVAIDRGQVTYDIDMKP